MQRYYDPRLPHATKSITIQKAVCYKTYDTCSFAKPYMTTFAIGEARLDESRKRVAIDII